MCDQRLDPNYWEEDEKEDRSWEFEAEYAENRTREEVEEAYNERMRVW